MFEIDPKELYDRTQHKDFMLVDIRTPEEHAEWFLDGTDALVDFYQPDFLENFKHLMQENREIIIYCRSGSRTMYVLYGLAYEGYQNIWHLRWGIELWQQDWYSLITK